MTEINPTKSALMDLAENILQTKSFSNVSFKSLADGVGIKKGSVYYHFESKEELGEAIIERATEQVRAGIESMRNEPIVKQLHVYCNWFAKHIGAGEALCPGANFAASWDAIPDSIKSKVVKLYKVHKAGLEQIIERGRQSGDFAQSELSSSQLATVVFSLLQGGLVAARVSQDKGEFAECKALALRLVKQG